MMKSIGITDSLVSCAPLVVVRCKDPRKDLHQHHFRQGILRTEETERQRRQRDKGDRGDRGDRESWTERHKGQIGL